MKKISILIFMALISAGSLRAQSSYFRMGFRIGGNMSTMYDVKADGVDAPSIFAGKASYKMKPGVRAGLVFNFKMNNVVIQPALYYTLQRWGSSCAYNLTDTIRLNVTEVMHMQMLHIPVMVYYNFHYGNKNHAFVIGAGPYLSVALSGKDVMDGTFYDNVTKQSLDVRGEANFYKNEQVSFYCKQIDDKWLTIPTKFDQQLYTRCDFGFSFAAGFQLKSFYIGAGCDVGAINTAKQKSWEKAGVHGYTQRNLNIHLTLGFDFN